MFDLASNYLYRYGTLIVLANYLIERKASTRNVKFGSFPEWLAERREVSFYSF
jgi:hypothetical protein